MEAILTILAILFIGTSPIWIVGIFFVDWKRRFKK